MKKLAFLLVLLMIAQNVVFSRPTVFNEDGKFGLKDEQGQVIADAKYKKMIRLGETGWIIQYRNKFGIMNDNGEIVVEPQYSRADRVLGKFVKLTKGDKNGMFDEKGFDAHTLSATVCFPYQSRRFPLLIHDHEKPFRPRRGRPEQPLPTSLTKALPGFSYCKGPGP